MRGGCCPRGPACLPRVDRRDDGRMTRIVLLTFAAVAIPWAAVAAVASPPPLHFDRIAVDPPQLALDGPECRFSLLVSGQAADGRTVDLTRQAGYGSKNPAIVEIGPDAIAQSAGDGRTEIEVTVAGTKVLVPVRVTGATRPRTLHFENDILPILSRFGCNSSGCHGKAEGQNGFKLSVFAFDPRADRAALLDEGRGRRIFPPHRMKASS